MKTEDQNIEYKEIWHENVTVDNEVGPQNIQSDIQSDIVGLEKLSDRIIFQIASNPQAAWFRREATSHGVRNNRNPTQAPEAARSVGETAPDHSARKGATKNSRSSATILTIANTVGQSGALDGTLASRRQTPRPLGGEGAMSGQSRLLSFVPQLGGQIQMAFARDLVITENEEVAR